MRGIQEVMPYSNFTIPNWSTYQLLWFSDLPLYEALSPFKEHPNRFGAA